MIVDNLARIQSSIEHCAKEYAKHNHLVAHKVTLVAVTKYQSVDSIIALHNLGHCVFGENKVQDLKAKIQAINAIKENLDSNKLVKTTKQHLEVPFFWHFIGTLQTNKINALLALQPILIHSVDSFALALTLDERCKRIDHIQDVLLQVNAANEATKHGFSLESAYDAFLEIRHKVTNLRLRGIMSIGAHSEDKAVVYDSFARTKELYDKIPDVDTLSMGMSEDFVEAIACGSNMVRIGSALFKDDTI